MLDVEMLPNDLQIPRKAKSAVFCNEQGSALSFIWQRQFAGRPRVPRLLLKTETLWETAPEMKWLRVAASRLEPKAVVGLPTGGTAQDPRPKTQGQTPENVCSLSRRLRINSDKATHTLWMVI